MNAIAHEHDALQEQEVLLRRIERTGWILGAVWVVALIVWALVDPEPYAQGWILVAELAFAGRVVSIYEGLRLDFSHLYLLIQCLPQDIILYLVAYPWVVRFYERKVRDTFVGRALQSVTGVGERHRKWLEPFGAVGLWIFIFFPFWSTGALVGGVVGYLLGMRFRVVFVTVLLGHGLSVVSLLYFLDWLEPILQRFDSGIARYFAWIVLVAVFAIGWTYQYAKKRFPRKVKQRPE